MMSTSVGDSALGSPHLIETTLALLSLHVPRHWAELVGESAPPTSWSLQEWAQDLVLRYYFIDRVLSTPFGKMPTYWLGGFFYPKTFLSVVQQVRCYMNILNCICVVDSLPL